MKYLTFKFYSNQLLIYISFYFFFAIFQNISWRLILVITKFYAQNMQNQSPFAMFRIFCSTDSNLSRKKIWLLLHSVRTWTSIKTSIVRKYGSYVWHRYIFNICKQWARGNISNLNLINVKLWYNTIKHDSVVAMYQSLDIQITSVYDSGCRQRPHMFSICGENWKLIAVSSIWYIVGGDVWYRPTTTKPNVSVCWHLWRVRKFEAFSEGKDTLADQANTYELHDMCGALFTYYYFIVIKMCCSVSSTQFLVFQLQRGVRTLCTHSATHADGRIIVIYALCQTHTLTHKSIR